MHVDGAAIGRIAAELVLARCRDQAIEQGVVDVGFRIIERRTSSV